MSEERQTNGRQTERRPPGITEAVSPASDGGSRAEPSPANLTVPEGRIRAQTGVPASRGVRRQSVEAWTGKSAHGQLGPVDLRIDELVLEGVSPGDRYRISEAIESELARLLAETSLPASLSMNNAVTNLDGGAIQIAAGTRPAAIGIRIARSIYVGLST